MKAYLVGITLGLFAQAAQAGEIVVAIGGSEISFEAARESGVAELSYRFDGSDDLVAVGVTVAAYEGGAVFAGAGIAGRQHFSGPWFVEGEAELGLVTHSGDTDPAVRASVAIGRSFGGNSRASLGLAQVAPDDATLTSATLRLHLEM